MENEAISAGLINRTCSLESKGMRDEEEGSQQRAERDLSK